MEATKSEGIKEESQPIGKAHDLKYYLVKEEYDTFIEKEGLRYEAFVVKESENIEEWIDELIDVTLGEHDVESFPVKIALTDNKTITFHSKEEVLSLFKITEISEQEYLTFNKHFKGYYGMCCWLCWLK